MSTQNDSYRTLDRRDFLFLVGSVGILGLLQACSGRNQPPPGISEPNPSEVLPPTVAEATTAVETATVAELPTFTQEATATPRVVSGPHVITELCIRDGACVEVCPVECIVPGMPLEEWPLYYIDPDTCINCGACVPECPAAAIFPVEDLPPEHEDAIEENERFFTEGPGYEALNM